MKVNGACHCGFVSFEAEVEPDKVQVCHCIDCQTLSGSPFRWVAFAQEGSFKLHSGQLKVYVKTAESGNQRAQSFCPECGSPIYSAAPGSPPARIGLRVGVLAQRGQLEPKRQIWTRSACDWVGELAAAPSSEKQ